MRSNSLAIHLKKSNKKTAAYCQRFSDTNPLLQLRQNFQQSENSVQNHLLFPPTSITRITPHWHIKPLTPALACQGYGIIDCASRIFYEIFYFFFTDPKPVSNRDIRRASALCSKPNRLFFHDGRADAEWESEMFYSEKLNEE
jgi:hypothetical protein